MLTIKESTRENPTKAVCSCGNEIDLTLHHDFLEGRCSCGKEYQIKVNNGVWNCCSKSVNNSNALELTEDEKIMLADYLNYSKSDDEGKDIIDNDTIKFVTSLIPKLLGKYE